jgi:hypothetical protein
MSVDIDSRSPSTRLSTRAPASDRFLWFSVAVATAIVLGLARWLVPDPSGLGTHTQLGLPRCLFLVLTGLPCPACGLTTCFAHMARGELVSAWHSSALGVALFALLASALPFTVWAGVRQRAFFETCARMRVQHIGGVWLCGLLVQWAVRVGCLLLG